MGRIVPHTGLKVRGENTREEKKSCHPNGLTQTILFYKERENKRIKFALSSEMLLTTRFVCSMIHV